MSSYEIIDRGKSTRDCRVDFVTGILFGLTMVMVSIALVMAVIVTNIFLRKDTKQRVPSALRRIFLRWRKFDDVGKPYRGNSCTDPPTTTLGHVNHGSLHRRLHSPEVDMDNLSILSEVDFRLRDWKSGQRGRRLRRLTPPDRCVGTGAAATPECKECGCLVGGPSNGDAAAVAPDDSPSSPSSFPSSSSSAGEWKVLAKVVDAVFFWVFVVSSVVCLLGLYASIPRPS